MSPWVFFDHLPPSLTAQQLESLCARYGQVLWGRVVSDPYDEEPSYGYVEMAHATQARSAARALDGHELSGRPIRAMLTDEPQASARA